MKKKLIFQFFIIFLFCNNAYAYLDPGTGGIILQALIAIFAGAVFYFRQTLNKIKSINSKILRYLIKKKNTKDKDS